MNNYCKIFLLLSLISITLTSSAQLTITTGHSANQLVQMLLGSGIQVTNITSKGINTGTLWSAGKFYQGQVNGLGIDSGVLLTSGNAMLATGPNINTNTGTNGSGLTDLDLEALSNSGTNDACVIEFDFYPSAGTLDFKYVFGSEEYPEYVNSYNDVFGFFLSGPNPAGGTYNKVNLAVLPTTTTESPVVSINNVNNGQACPTAGPCTNCLYYRDNCPAPEKPTPKLEYDGLTVVLTATLNVTPCVLYHIKIAIADGSPGGTDRVYDSGVFLQAGSFSSPSVTLSPTYNTVGGGNFAVEGCSQSELTVKLPFPRPNPSSITFDSIVGTATNGVDCNLVDLNVFFPAGVVTANIPIIPVYDAVNEPDEYLRFYISNQVGCAGVSITTADVSIKNLEKVSIGPDLTVCHGTPIVITPTPATYKAYLWQDGSTNATYNTNASTPGGTITLTATDFNNCTSSDTLQLNVNPNPPAKLIKHN